MDSPAVPDEESRGTDDSAQHPSAALLRESEGSHQTPAPYFQQYPYDPENPIEESLRRFGKFIKETFREAKAGERLTVLTDIVLIGVAITAAFIYGRQLVEMRKQVEVNTASIQIENRAWVEVDSVEPSAKCPDSPFQITFKNTGRSPAKGFYIRAIGETVAKGRPPAQPETLLPETGVLAPDGTMRSCVGTGHLNDYNWRGSDLIAHGIVYYSDVFGFDHWTKFCYFKSSKDAFSPCRDGNDIDSNGPQLGDNHER